MLLSEKTLDKIKSAELLISTDRLFDRFKGYNKSCISMPLSKIAESIRTEHYTKSIVVLASGDIGFYSISTMLKRELAEYELEFISGTSCLQYLTAKLQIPYDSIKCVSLHGRERSPLPYVSYNRLTFFLTGGKYKAHDIINELYNAELTDIIITVGENLSEQNERIITGKPSELLGYSFENLSVVLITNEAYINPHKTLKDSDFLRSEYKRVPMTKEAIRNLSLSALDIQPTDIIYDIGAGTGSISIAMAYTAYEGFVYAIEKEPSAVALIEQNRKTLKAYNLAIISAKAPQGLDTLPIPTKAFIGGSSGNLNEIFNTLYKKNPNIKIVINAITLETLNEAITCIEARGFIPDITCANISVAEKIGRYNMMKAQNPIYIIGVKDGEIRVSGDKKP